MKISRRSFLTTSATLGAASMAPLYSFASVEDGFLEITAGLSRHKLHLPDGADSELWTYNSSTPGPEIRIKKGERVKVRLINNLPEPTSIHWHGIRIENAMDGVSGLTQSAVQPGDSFEYDFVAPDAGTYWYHAHNKSWNQVARGLYGALIVEDEEPLFEPERDITLVIDDWRLARNGALETESLGSLRDWSHGGRLGNWLTVNSISLPNIGFFENQPHRLRLINASNARIFAIDPNRFDAQILAYDGQNLAEPITLKHKPLLLAPAQRVDLLVNPTDDFVIEELSGDTPFAFANFSMKPSSAPSGADKVQKPFVLKQNALPDPDLAKAKRFKLNMTGGAMGSFAEVVYKGELLNGEAFRRTKQVWAFNGVANLAVDPFFKVEAGQTVIIEITNNTAWMHAMHVHGHHFKILSRSKSEIDDGEIWRDTFIINPEQTTEIAFVADNKGKWLLHCHMLEHAAAGMNTWFEVV